MKPSSGACRIILIESGAGSEWREDLPSNLSRDSENMVVGNAAQEVLVEQSRRR
jgi:hypothetical protein